MSCMDDWHARARAAVDGLAKPPGSLGMLEDWAVKLCVLQQTLRPSISHAQLLVFAADHGVTITHPNVTAYPRDLSVSVFRAAATGRTASTVLARANGCHMEAIDVGLDGDVTSLCVAHEATHVGVTHAKVRHGTRDMTAGPAMSAEEMEAAMGVGRKAVDRTVQRHGPNVVLCVGELGIGNTTCAAAIVSALSGEPPSQVCGRGTGLDDAGVAYKSEVIARALAVNGQLISSLGAAGILQAVGGLEIAAMAGAYLRAAELSIATIVDGFISGAAALLALHLAVDDTDTGSSPSEAQRVNQRSDATSSSSSSLSCSTSSTTNRVWTCLFWSHVSHETGARALLRAAAHAASLPQQPRTRGCGGRRREGGGGGGGVGSTDDDGRWCGSRQDGVVARSCVGSAGGGGGVGPQEEDHGNNECANGGREGGCGRGGDGDRGCEGSDAGGCRAKHGTHEVPQTAGPTCAAVNPSAARDLATHPPPLPMITPPLDMHLRLGEGPGTHTPPPLLPIITPPLNMHLRLGEGTGAVLCVPLLRSAAAMMTGMMTLQDITGDKYA